MIMNAVFLSGDVTESAFYDQVTGEKKQPGHAVVWTVLDVDADEKYECRLTEGFAGLEHLKQLKRQGVPAEVLAEAVERLKTSFPPKMTPMVLDVRRITGKPPFLKLICRFARVPASA